MRARPISCCFSGHRRGKLPWGDDEGDRRCLALKERLWNEMEAAYERGYRHFICGMAQGCDLYFCELALALRQQFAGLSCASAPDCCRCLPRLICQDVRFVLSRGRRVGCLAIRRSMRRLACLLNCFRQLSMSGLFF